MLFEVNAFRAGVEEDLEFIFTDANKQPIGDWENRGSVNGVNTDWTPQAHLGGLVYVLDTDKPNGAVTFWFRRISKPSFMGSIPLFTIFDDPMSEHDAPLTVGGAIRRAGAVGIDQTTPDIMTKTDPAGAVVSLELTPAGGPYNRREII